MKIIDDFKELCVIIVLALSRKLLYKLQYFHQRGRFPNLKNPKDISEHILSEMMKPNFVSKYSDYADKIKVRQYLKDKGLEQILLKHFGVWTDANEIDFDKLPDKFVLKTNNGCGEYVFCRNKSTLDIKKSVKLINKTLHLPYYFNKEPHYIAIKPLIFCEELVDAENEDLPIDYKFTCINGRPFNIIVVVERNKKAKFCSFDMDWNISDNVKREQFPKKIPEKPRNLRQMTEIAKILSEGFNFVRVDLYDTGKKIWFGELTFTPEGGMMKAYTDEAIKLMGNFFSNNEMNNG